MSIKITWLTKWYTKRVVYLTERYVKKCLQTSTISYFAMAGNIFGKIIKRRARYIKLLKFLLSSFYYYSTIIFFLNGVFHCNIDIHIFSLHFFYKTCFSYKPYLHYPILYHLARQYFDKLFLTKERICANRTTYLQDIFDWVHKSAHGGFPDSKFH